MKHLLITGGAGFIGINAAEYFIDKGYQVTLFDNFSRARVDANINWLKGKFSDKFTVIKADVVKDQVLLDDLINRIDLVLHLAAQVAVTTSVIDPRYDMENNIIGTFNVLEAIRKSNNRPPIIYASTNKVYGGLEQMRVVEEEKRYCFDGVTGVNENALLDFHSPYGCSKGAADQYVRDYSRIYGLQTVVLRQSCIYGPHQFGIEDQGWLAWFIIASVLGKEISIYGNGKQVRDALYVHDLVRAYDMLFDNIDKVSGQIFNIGGGRENALSLLEFFEKLDYLSGRKTPFKFADWRPGDQPIYISDIDKLKRDINWTPVFSVDDGIKRLYDWVNDNIEIIKIV